MSEADSSMSLTELVGQLKQFCSQREEQHPDPAAQYDTNPPVSRSQQSMGSSSLTTRSNLNEEEFALAEQFRLYQEVESILSLLLTALKCETDFFLSSSSSVWFHSFTPQCLLFADSNWPRKSRKMLVRMRIYSILIAKMKSGVITSQVHYKFMDYLNRLKMR